MTTPIYGDGSNTISAGGTAQQIFGGAIPKTGFTLHNCDTTVDLWVAYDGATAAANASGSYKIPAGQTFTHPQGSPITGKVSLFSTKTGHAYSGRYW